MITTINLQCMGPHVIIRSKNIITVREILEQLYLCLVIQHEDISTPSNS